MKEKITKKLRNRKFRRVVVGAGLILSMGLNLGAKKPVEVSQVQMPNSIVSNEMTEIIDKSEEIIADELKENISDKIVSEYNKLGNNLVKQDLGCVLQSNEGISYLFTDQNGNYVFDITQNTDGLNRVNDNYSIIVFIDKQKENKPIASVGKINEKVIRVNVKSVDVNGSRSIQDSNNYLNDIYISFDEALDYLHKREAMIK